MDIPVMEGMEGMEGMEVKEDTKAGHSNNTEVMVVLMEVQKIKLRSLLLIFKILLWP